ARIFEKMFNVNFGDIYKKEIAVIKRKPIKITEFLDRLKAAIIQKSKDEGYYQL
ncbi:RteC domain-containing protein, partial [Bacteroides fragilis]